MSEDSGVVSLEGQPKHQPTEQTTRLVRGMSSMGFIQKDICTAIGVSIATLHKYYRKEIDEGWMHANLEVAKSLYRQATEEGNTQAMIFWLKARGGWTEKSEMALTGVDGGPLQITAVAHRIVDPKAKTIE